MFEFFMCFVNVLFKISIMLLIGIELIHLVKEMSKHSLESYIIDILSSLFLTIAYVNMILLLFIINFDVFKINVKFFKIFSLLIVVYLNKYQMKFSILLTLFWFIRLFSEAIILRTKIINIKTIVI
jgi:hypothetical protein